MEVYLFVIRTQIKEWIKEEVLNKYQQQGEDEQQ